MVVAHCEGTIPEVKKYIDIEPKWVYDGRVSRTVSTERITERRDIMKEGD